MNKIIIAMFSLMVFGVMLSGGAFAQEIQNVSVEVEEVISFDIDDTLDFGPLFPGMSATNPNTIVIFEENNVDLSFEVYLADGTDQFFNDALEFDLSVLGGNPNQALGVGIDESFLLSIADTDFTTAYDIPATMSIPTGASAGQRSATIIYEVSGPAPVTP